MVSFKPIKSKFHLHVSKVNLFIKLTKAKLSMRQTCKIKV